MRNKLSTSKPALILLIIVGLFVSCNDDYFYEENLPPGLGKSIYDYLQNDGNYNYFVRLIDDLEYTDVLSKTGSKTLFVTDDETFGLFFANADNPFGVTSYEGLSLAQKKIILNSAMLNNAILTEKLSTVEGPVEGQAIRRATAVTTTDSVGWERADKLPQSPANRNYWERFANSGIRLMKDNTTIPILFFLEEQMRTKNITESDFSLIVGKERETNDAYVYNIRVKERDITCQNGYIHVLEEVLIPPSNMADVLLSAPETTRFSAFLEAFSAPYYDGLQIDNDSVFVKGYFSERSSIVEYDSDNKTCNDPDGKPVSDLLLFDPGWNRYYASEITGSYQTDMGVIFAPTDAAMQDFFSNGVGQTLITRYGNEENIPNEVISKLLRNHMKPSFIASLPSQFHNIMNDAQENMGVSPADVAKTYLASNGVIYVTNKVYPPAIYSSVMFPTVINENMKVFYWAINNLDFSPYLLSMVNQYAFFLPQDGFTYIVPSSLGRTQPVAWKFRYDYERSSIYASIHEYNINTQQIGDSISVQRNTDILKNHLEDMLDYHIVVLSEDGETIQSLESDYREYYRTKGGGTIRVSRSGSQISRVAGGGDIERDNINNVQEVADMSNGGNGKTYILEQPIQSPVKSVYSLFEETPEFSDFFNLLKGNDDLWTDESSRAKYTVFYKDASNSGLDLNVRFLNTYHYTLYVPTNEAVQKAHAEGLPTWQEVENERNEDRRVALAEEIIRFVRYHFQDNAVFVEKNMGGRTITNSYETATLNKNTDTFFQLDISRSAGSLHIRTASGGTADVVQRNGLYNIMARDFKFDTDNAATANRIETSSYVVIHQIDKCLYFDN